MTKLPRRPDRAPAPHGLRPRDELDGMVANVELTLISIVQGVALYFLTDSTRGVLADLRWRAIPYVVAGLLLVLSVWTRSVIHAFTVIRWPLELGHNFFYIVGVLFEATLFTQIGQPTRWFPLSVAMGAVYLVNFLYERRLYRIRRADSAGPRGAHLLDVLEREHALSLGRLVPGTLLVWVAGALLVWALPETFVRDGWHVALAAVQALGLLVYLAWVWRFFASITGLIVAARAEWEARP